MHQGGAGQTPPADWGSAGGRVNRPAGRPGREPAVRREMI